MYNTQITGLWQGHPPPSPLFKTHLSCRFRPNRLHLLLLPVILTPAASSVIVVVVISPSSEGHVTTYSRGLGNRVFVVDRRPPVPPLTSAASSHRPSCGT